MITNEIQQILVVQETYAYLRGYFLGLPQKILVKIVTGLGGKLKKFC